MQSLLPCPSGPLVIPSAPSSDSVVKLSLVLPTYNESANVPAMIDMLTSMLDRKLSGRYELIVVDDDSPDRTWEVALELSEVYPQVRVIRRQGERGLATAIIRGWQAARGNVLGVIDADLQHPPEISAALWAEIERGADLAVGSRHIVGGGVSDWSFLRRVLSRSAQILGLLILPDVLGRLSDPMSGCFLIRRSAIGGRALHPLGYKILLEVLARGDVQWIGEVGYVFRERDKGESKITSHLYFEYLLHLLRLRWARLPSAQFARFAVVGMSGVIIDMAVLYMLSDPARLGWGLTRSKLIASELAILNNFLWNDVWTFREAALQDAPGQWVKRLLKFNMICGMGLVLNVGLLNIEFNSFGMNRYEANAIAIVVVTVWNYWLNKKLAWKVTGGASGNPGSRRAVPIEEINRG